MLVAALCVVPLSRLAAQEATPAARDPEVGSPGIRSRVSLTGTTRSYQVGDSSVAERSVNGRYELFVSRVRLRVDASLVRFATRTDTIDGSLPTSLRLDFATRPGDTLSAFARTASRPFDLTTRQTAALGTAGTSTLDLESFGFGTPAMGGVRMALAFPVGELVLSTRAGLEVEPRPSGTAPVYWRGTTLRGGLALRSSYADDASATASVDVTRSGADSLGGRNTFPGGGSVTLQLSTDATVANPFDPLEDDRWPLRALAFYSRPFSNDRADQPNLLIPQGNLLGAVATLLVSAGELTIAPTLQLLRESSSSESMSGIVRSVITGSAWTAQASVDVTIPVGSRFELAPQAGYTFGSVGAGFSQSVATRRGRVTGPTTSFSDGIRGHWLAIQLSAAF